MTFFFISFYKKVSGPDPGSDESDAEVHHWRVKVRTGMMSEDGEEWESQTQMIIVISYKNTTEQV